MPRKYVPKGNNGGKRTGAGRPQGSKAVLGYGQVKATIAAGLRVPEDATPEQRKLADRAQQRIIDVMEEKVSYLSSGGVLKAAASLREEICGAVKQKIEHSGLDSLTDEQLKARYEKLQAEIASAPKEPEGDLPTPWVKEPEPTEG